MRLGVNLALLRTAERLEVDGLEVVRRDWTGSQRLSVNRSDAYVSEPTRDRHTFKKPLWLDFHDLSGVLARGHDELEPEDELWRGLMLEHGRRRVDVDRLIGSVWKEIRQPRGLNVTVGTRLAHLMVL